MALTVKSHLTLFRVLHSKYFWEAKLKTSLQVQLPRKCKKRFLNAQN